MLTHKELYTTSKYFLCGRVSENEKWNDLKPVERLFFFNETRKLRTKKEMN